MYSSNIPPPLPKAHGQVASMVYLTRQKRCFSTTDATERALGYHRAVRKGPFICVSGITAVKLLGEIEDDDSGKRGKGKEVVSEPTRNVEKSAGKAGGVNTKTIPAGSGFTMGSVSIRDERRKDQAEKSVAGEMQSDKADPPPMNSSDPLTEAPPPYEYAGMNTAQSTSSAQPYLTAIPERQTTLSSAPAQKSTSTSRIHYPNNPNRQAHLSLSRSIEAVQRLGGTREDIVRVRLLIARHEDIPEISAAFRELFSADSAMERREYRFVNEQIVDKRAKRGDAGILISNVGTALTMVVVGEDGLRCNLDDGMDVGYGEGDCEVRVMVEVDAVCG